MNFNIDEIFASDYLKATDLGSKVHRLMVDNVTLEEMRDGKNGVKDKPVIWFRGAKKGLAVNVTNARTLAKEFGPLTDGWIGKEIELFVTQVPHPSGGMTDGIRVRAIPDKPESVIGSSTDLAAEEGKIPF